MRTQNSRESLFDWLHTEVWRMPLRVWGCVEWDGGAVLVCENLHRQFRALQGRGLCEVLCFSLGMMK